MVDLLVNNNKVKLEGNRKVLNIIYDKLGVKHPGAWHIRKYMQKGWDGKIHYLTEAGYAKTGLVPRIVALLEEANEDYQLFWNDQKVARTEIPFRLGTLELRDYQRDSIRQIVQNTIKDMDFPRGLVDAATNAGKSLIMAGIHKSFKNLDTLVLLNDSDLYDQFKRELPLLVGSDFGCVRGKEVKWGKFTIAMVQTLSRNMGRFKAKLATFNAVLVDECDLATSKSYTSVLTACFNAYIRIGLSGSIGKHKDPTKNMDIEAYFGKVLFTITKMELVKKGVSTPLVIKISEGNTLVRENGNFTLEYEKGITSSLERENSLVERVTFNVTRGRVPILITAQYHKHVERLYEVLKPIFGDSVDYVHHKREGRFDILSRFRGGDLPILISSMIIKRGKNFPLLKCVINAGGGDSASTVTQLMGRGERKHESKKKTYFEDFADDGAYLKRHSRHRYKEYKKSGFKVIILGKNAKKLLGIKNK